MLGLFLLFLFALYLWVWWKIAKFFLAKQKNNAAKLSLGLMLALVAFAIPFGDEIIGRIYFEQVYCPRESGLKVYRKMVAPNGMIINSSDEKIIENWLKSGNFLFLEYEKNPKKFVKFSLLDKKLKRDVLTKAESNYRFFRNQLLVTQQVRKDAFVIQEISSGNTLGEYVKNIYLGGWMQRTFLPFKNDLSCTPGFNYLIERSSLINSVFNTNLQ